MSWKVVKSDPVSSDKPTVPLYLATGKYIWIQNIKGSIGKFCETSYFDLSLNVSNQNYPSPSLQSHSLKTHEHNYCNKCMASSPSNLWIRSECHPIIAFGLNAMISCVHYSPATATDIVLYCVLLSVYFSHYDKKCFSKTLPNLSLKLIHLPYSLLCIFSWGSCFCN